MSGEGGHVQLVPHANPNWNAGNVDNCMKYSLLNSRGESTRGVLNDWYRAGSIVFKPCQVSDFTGALLFILYMKLNET